MAAGSLPAGDVRVRFRETVPSAAALPDERARDDWPDMTLHNSPRTAVSRTEALTTV